MDALRHALSPEIEQKLIELVGTFEMPVIRILTPGLFASGSAEVQPQFTELLERIGEALAPVGEEVKVIGYTDNQPIRSAQFPSNLHLSAARARAAANIIERTIGSAAAISAEGRGDADPIASNVTSEGRKENRRIEVGVLRRRN